MNILIVEDDEMKRAQIANFLLKAFDLMHVSFAKSLQSGLRSIIQGEHDLVILDMSMPTYDISADEDGGRPQAYAGREILRQMNRRDISTPVVVVTQFDKFGEGVEALTLSELDKRLRNSHPTIYLGAVYYDVSFAGWQDELKAAIEIARSRREAR